MKVSRLRERVLLERRERLERVLLDRLVDARLVEIDDGDAVRRKQRTELAQLARAPRREQQRPPRHASDAERAPLRRVELAKPSIARSSSASSSTAIERAVLAGALHLDEAAFAAHHDIHVDVGAHVLLVVEIEPRRRRR